MGRKKHFNSAAHSANVWFIFITQPCILLQWLLWYSWCLRYFGITVLVAAYDIVALLTNTSVLLNIGILQNPTSLYSQLNYLIQSYSFNHGATSVAWQKGQLNCLVFLTLVQIVSYTSVTCSKSHQVINYWEPKVKSLSYQVR